MDGTPKTRRFSEPFFLCSSPSPSPPCADVVVPLRRHRLFWHIFSTLPSSSQRLLLAFITGSDRIPATGSSALTLKLTNMGRDTGRWPTSHTCFNELCLYRYATEERMREMLQGASEQR